MSLIAALVGPLGIVCAWWWWMGALLGSEPSPAALRLEERLRQHPPEVLVLGNSMARTGLDPVRLGLGPKVEVVAPDEATAADHVAVLRNRVPAIDPPRLVIVATTPAFLADLRPRSDAALARLEGQLGPADDDLRLKVAQQEPGSPVWDRVRARRDLVRSQVFGGAARAAVAWVHGEEEAAGALQRWEEGWGPEGIVGPATRARLPVSVSQPGRSAVEAGWASSGLPELLEATGAVGAELAVVWLPTRVADPTPPALIEALRAQVVAAPGAVWIDLSTWQLPDAVWLDEAHVERWGRAALSRGVGEALTALGAPGPLRDPPTVTATAAGTAVCGEDDRVLVVGTGEASAVRGATAVHGREGGWWAEGALRDGACWTLEAPGAVVAVALPLGEGWATVWGDPSAVQGPVVPLLDVRDPEVRVSFEAPDRRREVVPLALQDGLVLLAAPELGQLSAEARLGRHLAVNCDPVGVWADGELLAGGNAPRSSLLGGGPGHLLVREGVLLGRARGRARYEVGLRPELVGLGCEEGVWVAGGGRTTLRRALPVGITGGPWVVQVVTEGFGEVHGIVVTVELDGAIVQQVKGSVGVLRVEWDGEGREVGVSVEVEGEGAVLWRGAEVVRPGAPVTL